MISVQSYRSNAFSEDDLILLTAVANQAAVALANARLYQDLESLNEDLERRVEARTAQGSSVRIDATAGVVVDNANVIAADVEATNGVIHVIDRVIVPRQPAEG